MGCSGSGLKQGACAGVNEHLRNEASEGGRIGVGARGGMVDAHGFTGLRRSDDGEDLVGGSNAGFKKALTTMDADGHLTSAAEGSKGCALCRDGEARGRVIEEGDGFNGGGIAFAGFNAKRTLAGRGAEVAGIKALAQPIGLAEALEAGGGQQDGVNLSFGELAQAGVDVTAKLDGVDVRAQSL